MKTFIEIFKEKSFVTNSILFFIFYSLLHSLLLNLPFTKDAISRTALQSLAVSIVFGFALTSLQQKRFAPKRLIVYSLGLLIVMSLICWLLMALFFS